MGASHMVRKHSPLSPQRGLLRRAVAFFPQNDVPSIAYPQLNGVTVGSILLWHREESPSVSWGLWQGHILSASPSILYYALGYPGREFWPCHSLHECTVIKATQYRGKHKIAGVINWLGDQNLFLLCCVTSGNSLNLSELQFPILQVTVLLPAGLWGRGSTTHIVFHTDGTPSSAMLWDGATQWPELWDGNKTYFTCLAA